MPYPIFLKLKNRRCLVIGGGAVAERKVLSLLKAGATVSVVSPDLTLTLKELAQARKIDFSPINFENKFPEDVFLVIGATDDYVANKRIGDEAEHCGILCNIIDSPEQSSFYVPSIVDRGDLQIAISTNGKSPALSKKLRKMLEEEIGEEYSDLLEVMNRIRLKAIKLNLNQKTKCELYSAILDSDILEALRRNKKEGMEKADKIARNWKQKK